MRRGRAWLVLFAISIVLSLIPGTPPAEGASNLPAGFTMTSVITGLSLPTVARFAPDGRVFITEKRGLLKVFSSLTDTSADIAVDLRAEVYDFWDRGLLGMALHPNFPATPYVYLLYTWDIAGYNDGCPSNPGATEDGCMANGRLLRVSVNPSNQVVDSPTVMLDGNWCQQFPSHSIGSLDFGPEGALYISAGDGASFNVVDTGGEGGSKSPVITPENPCSDPNGEGGALRSQDLRTTGDPVTFDGTVLRIDPITGAAWPGNPLIGGDATDDRIIANGLRNPFRMTVADDGQVWIGDVGWGEWEEINRIPNPNAAPIRNFGWPCYEGASPHSGYSASPICSGLTPTAPHFTYRHGSALRSCPEAPGSTSAITGLAFYEGGSYPNSYDGSLFFTDYSRKCIWVMEKGQGGLPDPALISRFATVEPSVGLYVGPAGDIFSLDHIAGALRRISFSTANSAPTAAFAATPTSGPAPLTVSFNAGASTDVDGDPITYAWDLDADGAFDDAFTPTASFTYSSNGNRTVGLRVDDGRGGTDTESTVIAVGGTSNTAPTPSITGPSSALRWAVGDTVNFSGSAFDQQDGQMQGPSLRWSLVLNHCAPNVPTDCHQHPISEFTGLSGSFTTPDHEFPSHLVLSLTATDSGGLTGTTSIRLDPQTVAISFASLPSGLQISLGPRLVVTPVTVEMILKSRITVNAASGQALAGSTYDFFSWSDEGAASHLITANASGSLTATFNGRPVARLTASPTTGHAGTTVSFNAGSSSDPEGRPLVYAWDLDGNSTFETTGGTTRTFTYLNAGRFSAQVRVTDDQGATSTATVIINIKKGKGPK